LAGDQDQAVSPLAAGTLSGTNSTGNVVILLPAVAFPPLAQNTALLTPQTTFTDPPPASTTTSDPAGQAATNQTSPANLPGGTATPAPTTGTGTGTGTNNLGPSITNTGTGMGNTGTGTGTGTTGGTTTTNSPASSSSAIAVTSGQSAAPLLATQTGTNAPPGLAPLATQALESPSSGIITNTGQTTAPTFNAPPPITFGAQGPLAAFLANGRGPGDLIEATDGTAVQRLQLGQALGVTVAGLPSLRSLSAFSGGAFGQEEQAQQVPPESAPPRSESRDVNPDADGAWIDGVGRLDAQPEGQALDDMLGQVFPAGTDLSGWLAQDGMRSWMLGLAVAGTSLELTRRRSAGLEDEEEDRRQQTLRRRARPVE
jgi:hypothetical protein